MNGVPPLSIFSVIVFLLAPVNAGLAQGEPAPEHPGAVIYAKQCAECHGKTGEGVPDEFEDPLLGDRSIKSLAKLISKTMPEEEPKTCVGEDAEQVADFVYHAFYSPVARERLGRGPNARVEVTRLTVNQYRNVVADLVGRFDPKWENVPGDDGQRGFNGEYFTSNGMNKKEKHQLKRMDGQIAFDFGEGSPGEGIAADQFSIAWDGTFFAPDDGTYEFKVHTPNGARLYVNADLKPGDFNYRDDSSDASHKPLIDAWVSSGNTEREESAKVYLMGGRSYPIRLDFFKYKEKLGAIRLEWKPPHGVWDVLGGSDVRPVLLPRVFVVSTPFPADDASLGYERGSSMSQQWLEAVTKSAQETAEEVLGRSEQLARAGEKDPNKDKKMREFCGRFLEAAFRRSLPDAERQSLVDAIFKDSGNSETALKRCVLYALTSPRFLYPELRDTGATVDPYTVASRLSFILWDSMPDATLMAAASKNELEKPDQINWHTERMLKDPRAKAKMHGFLEDWLEMDSRELSKDGKLYPEFDAGMMASLRKSLNLFLDEVVWSGESDYRQLLTADYLLLDERLKKIYGGEKVGDGAGKFDKMRVEKSARSGVLTHPYLLSVFAYHNNTSPIHRGVFLTRNIMGRMLKPPPNAVAFKNDEFDPSLTMREKVVQLTGEAACMSCHSLINPLGFSLENFDAVGRWQDTDNQKPVDPRSEYTTAEGETISLTSARDVGNFAVGSEDAHRAFVATLFHHFVKQSIDAYGVSTLSDLREHFEEDAYNIQKLLMQIAAKAAIYGKPTS